MSQNSQFEMKNENNLKNFALIGSSLKHSFSADYFNSKFRALGIGCKYSNFALDCINEFQDLLINKQWSLNKKKGDICIWIFHFI